MSEEIAAIVLGRAEERVRIELMLDAVPIGVVGLVLEGVPGIGKTALWREGVESARRRGYRVLESAPAEPDAALAFAGLGDLFDRLPEQLLVTLPDPQRRALAAALLAGEVADVHLDASALPRAVLQVLRRLSADRPVVVAIDDEQWLDRASARVFAFALCRLRDERVGVLVCRRARSDGALWSELARGFRGQGIDTLDLRPLEMDAIDGLVRAHLSRPISRPLLRRVREASGGNPLYAIAIAREIEARQAHAGEEQSLPIPVTLAVAMAQRLQRLDPRTRDPLLVIAAVSQPTLAVLQAVIPDFALSDLESAEQAGVIHFTGDCVHFTHPLLASSHYAGVPGSRRRALHRRLADVVEDLEQRAYHLALGAEAADREIASVLERAAGAAAGRGAPEVAAELLESAVRLTPRDDVEECWSRTIAAATHHFDSGLLTRARELVEALVPKLPHGPTRARALRLLAVCVTSDLDAAQGLLEEALADAGDDYRVRAELEGALHGILGAGGKFAATARHAQAAVEAASRAGDQGLLAATLARHAWTAFLCGQGIQPEIRKAIELEGCMSATTQRLPTTILARMLLFSNDYAAARPMLERAVARAREHGELHDYGWLLLDLARLEWEAGNHAAAERHMVEAENAVGECDDEGDLALLTYNRAIFATDRGELAEARALADQALRLAGGYVLDAAVTTICLAAIELGTGQPAAAHDRLRPLRESMLANGLGHMGNPVLGLWSYDIEALIATGQLDDAEQVLTDLLDRARACANPHAVAISQRCKALLLAARGNIAGALDAIETALAQHARRPVALETGRTLLEKGALQRRAKQKSAAKKTLEEALAILEALNATPHISRAQDQLARIGLRRPTPTDGITPVRARVTELVIAGMSNPEIANTLYISVRTVEAHLTKIYRDLGVRTRSQMIAAVATNTPKTNATTHADDEPLSTPN